MLPLNVTSTANSTTHPSPLHHPLPPAPAMSSIIGRTAFRAAPRLRATNVARRWESSASDASTAERKAGKEALKAGAKRDPELYVCQTPSI